MDNIKDYVESSVKENLDGLLKYYIEQDPIKIAVAMSLGIVFTQLSVGIISDVVKPIVSIIAKVIFTNGFKVRISSNEFNFDDIIIKFITFIIFIIIIYFLIIVPLEKIKRKYNINTNKSQCTYCRTIIDSNATRCPFCTSELKPGWGGRDI